MRLKQETLIRYLLFLMGLWMSALGISLATKAGLGVSPISSVPYVLSIGLPLTMGTFTFLFNMLFVIGQIVLLGREFEKLQLLQILLLVIFGYFIDLTLWMLSIFDLTNYIQKFIFLLLGCVVLAMGISMQVTANVLIIPGDALVRVISIKLKREFGKVKVCFDTTIVVIAAVLSFFMLHRIDGIREGTLLAALTIGFIVKSFNKLLGPVCLKFTAGQ
jgi:uncharacterized membrane protein YczE